MVRPIVHIDAIIDKIVFFSTWHLPVFLDNLFFDAGECFPANGVISEKECIAFAGFRLPGIPTSILPGPIPGIEGQV
jgi:hypothetical protein